MKKTMTLLATSLFALYGCGGGGGSSSGSTDGNKGPTVRLITRLRALHFPLNQKQHWATRLPKMVRLKA